ncbi:MAG: hypothetical protein AAF517_26140, partial [Planctomycetota bacterium]
VLDSCELLGRDCNRDGQLDVCELQEFPERDCDGNGVHDACDPDCDENGMPDACDLESPGVDCDGNGIVDDCDIERDPSLDANDNDVPDVCENEPGFYARLIAEEAEVSSASEYARIEVGLWLHTYGIAPGEPGAQGWSIAVEIRGDCTQGDSTTEGTAAAADTDDPPGFRQTGFERTQAYHSASDGRHYGVSTAVVLSFTDPITLPTDRAHKVLRIFPRVQLREDELPSTCRLFVGDSSLGYAQGVISNVTYDGSTTRIRSIGTSLTAEFVPFRRGDFEGDGLVNISDAVATFSFLFLGGEATSCEEAGDVNRDHRIDIADGIALLTYLFGDGPAPSAPGAEDCGLVPVDPWRPDVLPCESYTSCAR